MLTTAVSRETLHDFATIVGTELLHIDADTSVPQLTKEIRWNSAYYRLAQGL